MPQLVQDGARRSSEHTFRAGDGIGVGIQSSRINHAAATGSITAPQGYGHAVRGSDVGHCGVDKRIQGSLGGGIVGGQGTGIATAHGLAVAGTQHQLGLHMHCPRLRQTPSAGHAVTNVGGLLRRLARQGTQATAHNLRQHRAERTVAGGGGGHAGLQRIDVRLCRTINGGHTQLGGHVHEQLVTAGGYAIGEGFCGVATRDLVQAHLVLHRKQEHDRIRSGKRQLTSGRATRRCGGSGCRSSLSGGCRLSGCLGRSCLSRCFLGLGGGFLHHRSGLRIGQVHGIRVALDVEHAHRCASVLRKIQGAGGQVGQRGCRGQTNLHNVLHLRLVDQQILRLNPADRGGELPAQQLNHEHAGKLGGGAGGLALKLAAIQQFLQRFGGNNIQNCFGEVAGQLEGASHQVRHVAVDQGVHIQFFWQQRIQLVGKRRDSGAQNAGVEGHVNAGDFHVGALSAALLGVRSQGLQAGDRAGHGILLASHVEVHNLQELPGALGDVGNVVHDFRVTQPEHIGAQRAQAVVGASSGIALNQGVHGGAAREHDVDHGFQVEDVGQRGQCRVLAQGVSRVEGAGHNGACFAEAFGLAVGHHGQSHLRELR